MKRKPLLNPPTPQKKEQNMYEPFNGCRREKMVLTGRVQILPENSLEFISYYCILGKTDNHLFDPTYGLNNSVSWALLLSIADSLIEGKAWIRINRSEWRSFDYQHLFSHDGYMCLHRENLRFYLKAYDALRCVLNKKKYLNRHITRVSVEFIGCQFSRSICLSFDVRQICLHLSSERNNGIKKKKKNIDRKCWSYQENCRWLE